MNIWKLINLDCQRHLMYLIVPIAAALILGAMYSHTYVDNIPIGIVDLDGSSLSRNITRQFSIHPGLTITSYPASESEAYEEIYRQSKTPYRFPLYGVASFSKQIAVGSGTGQCQYKNIIIDAIHKQPVALNMTFPIRYPIPG